MSEDYDLSIPQVADPYLGAQVGEQPLIIHPPSACEGHHCPFHNPSQHALRDAPLNVRLDRSALTERICEHGIGHPDPDSVAWLTQTYGDNAWDVHGCDGCCHG